MKRTLLCALLLLAAAPGAGAQSRNFIRTRGDRLMDGDNELRFVSYNIPNLAYIEDDHRFEQVNPFRVADEFEIRDALETIRQTGGRVTRMYVPSVHKAGDDPSVVRHVLAPGEFNEEAFRSYDRILQVANEKHVRVIIPLVDNWWWWGGPNEYAAFRGKKREEFWTDSLLIADFRKTVAFLITRVNTLTGVAYRDDPAILGWETGNELDCPYGWTRGLAAYIKGLDTNHLVIEGTNRRTISDEALNDPNIDVLSTHYYSPAAQTIPAILAARGMARGKKPYFVGEFGYIPVGEMRQVIDTVIASGVSGIMVWSLRTHNRDGGFYYHQNAYRWPGFPSGRSWEEEEVTALFREKAAAINGTSPPAPAIPAVPALLPVESPYRISWQGSTGATSYLIERKSAGDPFWTVISANATDAAVGYRPLYADTTAEPGTRYAYRLRARSAAGYSDLSDPSLPVAADARVLIDELADGARWFSASGGVTFVPPQDAARAKEDRSRIRGAKGEFIEYGVRGSMTSFRVDLFATAPGADTTLVFLAGNAADSLAAVPVTREVFAPLRNEYGAYTAVRVAASGDALRGRFLRIDLAPGCQIARVEISYR